MAMRKGKRPPDPGDVPGGASPKTATSLQMRIEEIARHLTKDAALDSGINRLPLLSRRMMALAMDRPHFRTQLFRLVDVVPAIRDSTSMTRHLREYLLDAPDTPKSLRAALKVVSSNTLFRWLAHRITIRSIEKMAGSFIIGSTQEEVGGYVRRLLEAGIGSTVDVLGEKTVTPDDATRYRMRAEEVVHGLVSLMGASEADLDATRVGMSIKPTALSVHYHPLSSAVGVREAGEAIRGILGIAHGRSFVFWLDMEEYEVKELTVALLQEIALDEGHLNAEMGIVLQAYLPECQRDIGSVVELSNERVRRGGRPLWIRLVKGAYHDWEISKAALESWMPPVYLEKMATDANYEVCTKVLLEHIDEIRPAFATHNLRSIAHAIAVAEELGVPLASFEIQMLHGMADPMAFALAAYGCRVRMYLPSGDLVSGMAYLVRRLLENTANESFLKAEFHDHLDLDTLLRTPTPAESVTRGVEGAGAELSSYTHAATARFHEVQVRDHYVRALSSLRDSRTFDTLLGTSGRRITPIVDGRSMDGGKSFRSVNPARPSEIVADVSATTRLEFEDAFAVARKAGILWGRTEVGERIAVMSRAASWLESKRAELSALEVLETGKPVREADADIAEAIDFLRYYSEQFRELMASRRLDSPSGERNEIEYRPVGTVGVISPWNFPIAIPMGMCAAAILGGNAVLFKPAEQSPASGLAVLRALEFGGLPPGVLNFLPGDGDVGKMIVDKDEVALIAFTGSREVGVSIIKGSGHSVGDYGQPRRVVVEMGGKNPIIVDDDVDLDHVVPAVIASAFGFSGQKCSACSRLILLSSNADEVIRRLIGALHAISVGDPSDPSNDVGPVVEAGAVERIADVLAKTSAHHRVIQGAEPSSGDGGYFVRPTIVLGVERDDEIFHRELFGPVLAVTVVDSLDHAIVLANASEYALTAGFFSRSNANIREVRTRVEAGNIYVNRSITGAIPGRHPFGGFKLSGVGAKAGGPEYLQQFIRMVAHSENTVRQGFAAQEGA